MTFCVTTGIKSATKNWSVLSHQIFTLRHRLNDHYCFISSSSRGIKVFVTVKPVVTEPTDCVPLEQYAIKCDRCIGNYILEPSVTHSWQVIDENHNYFMSSLQRIFLGVEGSEKPRVIEKMALTMSNEFLLLKTSGEVACKASALLYGLCCP